MTAYLIFCGAVLTPFVGLYIHHEFFSEFAKLRREVRKDIEAYEKKYGKKYDNPLWDAIK